MRGADEESLGCSLISIVPLAKKAFMPLLEQLSTRQSKASIEQLADETSGSPALLNELWDLIENASDRPADQASWAWYKIAQKRSDRLNRFVRHMLAKLATESCSAPIRRNLLGSLQYTQVGEDDAGLLLDLAFRFMEDPTEPVAVRALSMGILGNLVPRYPDLVPELILILNDLLAHPQTAAIKARGRNVLKALKRTVK